MIVGSLSYCRTHKGLKVYAYVLMENHFHMIASAPALGRIMQSFKRFTAAEILRLTEASGRDWLLNQFA
jgi:REP element-mobilizing transposase RayT